MIIEYRIAALPALVPGVFKDTGLIFRIELLKFKLLILSTMRARDKVFPLVSQVVPLQYKGIFKGCRRGKGKDFLFPLPCRSSCRGYGIPVTLTGGKLMFCTVYLIQDKDSHAIASKI